MPRSGVADGPTDENVPSSGLLPVLQTLQTPLTSSLVVVVVNAPQSVDAAVVDTFTHACRAPASLDAVEPIESERERGKEEEVGEEEPSAFGGEIPPAPPVALLPGAAEEASDDGVLVEDEQVHTERDRAASAGLRHRHLPSRDGLLLHRLLPVAPQQQPCDEIVNDDDGTSSAHDGGARPHVLPPAPLERPTADGVNLHEEADASDSGARHVEAQETAAVWCDEEEPSIGSSFFHMSHRRAHDDDGGDDVSSRGTDVNVSAPDVIRPFEYQFHHSEQPPDGRPDRRGGRDDTEEDLLWTDAHNPPSSRSWTDATDYSSRASASPRREAPPSHQATHRGSRHDANNIVASIPSLDDIAADASYTDLDGSLFSSMHHSSSGIITDNDSLAMPPDVTPEHRPLGLRGGVSGKVVPSGGDEMMVFEFDEDDVGALEAAEAAAAAERLTRELMDLDADQHSFETQRDAVGRPHRRAAERLPRRPSPVAPVATTSHSYLDVDEDDDGEVVQQPMQSAPSSASHAAVLQCKGDHEEDDVLAFDDDVNEAAATSSPDQTGGMDDAWTARHPPLADARQEVAAAQRPPQPPPPLAAFGFLFDDDEDDGQSSNGDGGVEGKGRADRNEKHDTSHVMSYVDIDDGESDPVSGTQHFNTTHQAGPPTTHGTGEATPSPSPLHVSFAVVEDVGEVVPLPPPCGSVTADIPRDVVSGAAHRTHPPPMVRTTSSVFGFLRTVELFSPPPPPPVSANSFVAVEVECLDHDAHELHTSSTPTPEETAPQPPPAPPQADSRSIAHEMETYQRDRRTLLELQPAMIPFQVSASAAPMASPDTAQQGAAVGELEMPPPSSSVVTFTHTEAEVQQESLDHNTRMCETDVRSPERQSSSPEQQAMVQGVSDMGHQEPSSGHQVGHVESQKFNAQTVSSREKTIPSLWLSFVGECRHRNAEEDDTDEESTDPSVPSRCDRPEGKRQSMGHRSVVPPVQIVSTHWVQRSVCLVLAVIVTWGMLILATSFGVTTVNNVAPGDRQGVAPADSGAQFPYLTPRVCSDVVDPASWIALILDAVVVQTLWTMLWSWWCRRWAESWYAAEDGEWTEEAEATRTSRRRRRQLLERWILWSNVHPKTMQWKCASSYEVLQALELIAADDDSVGTDPS